MKLPLPMLALFFALFMTCAYAAPETAADAHSVVSEQADPIARFASSPGEEAVGDLLLQAMSLIGVAYRFGGNSPNSGLDCSGFIKYVFEKSLKVNLPRTAAEMARVGKAVSRDELAAGDLVFFNTRGFRNSHVGIYLGGSKFIHSPRSGKSVEVSNMNGSYWTARYDGARRVQRGQAVEAEPPAVPAVRKALPAKAEPPKSKAGAERGSKQKSSQAERSERSRKKAAPEKSVRGKATDKKKKSA